MAKIVKIFVLISLILMSSLNITPLPSAQAQDFYVGRMYLEPPEAAHYLNTFFDVNIMVDTGGQNSDAADAILYYDPEYLELQDSIDTMPGVQVKPGSIYEMYPGNLVDTVNGRIQLTAFSVLTVYNTANYGGAPQVFATMRFKAIKFTDGTPVLFDFVPSTGDFYDDYQTGTSQDSNIAQAITSADILGSAIGGVYRVIEDDLPPLVININPPNGAVNVPANTNISFNVQDNETGVDITTLVIWIEGVPYTVDSPYVTYTGTPTNYRIVIDLPANFDYNQEVNLRITVSDLSGNDAEAVSTFTIGPAPVNLPPVWDPEPEKTAVPGTELMFLIRATDPNGGDQLTIVMENPLPGMTIENVGNGLAIIRWTPGADDVGIYDVNFTVYDNGEPSLSDFMTVRIRVVEPVDEPPCFIDCAEVTFDLYIVNPDGTERHMNTEWTRIETVNDNVFNIYFEDKGVDIDYNDVILQVDKTRCDNIVVTVLEFNADWHHQIRIELFHQNASYDLLLWEDSFDAVAEVSTAINIYDYPILCGVELPFVCPPCAPCGQRTACQDNIDNDGDGRVDWPSDLQCIDREDDDELVFNDLRQAWEDWRDSAAVVLSPARVVDFINNNKLVQAVNKTNAGNFVISRVLKMASTPGTGAFSLSPAAGNYYPGQRFDVNVLIETGNTNTDSADIVVYYDPLYLEVVDALPAPGIQIKPGTIYEAYPGNVVNPAAGEIKATGFSIATVYNSGSGSGVFATIPFRALQIGDNLPVSFYYAAGETIDSNITIEGTDILAQATNGSYNIIPDSSPPYITNFLPAFGAENRPVGQDVSFRIKDDQTSVDINSVAVRIDDVVYRANSSPSFTYSGTAQDYLITVALPNFPYDYQVDIYIDAEDSQSNTMSTYYSWFKTMIEPINAPPVLNSISDYDAAAGASFAFTVTASDADNGDNLNYSLVNAPAGAVITRINRNLALFEWPIPADAAGSYYPTVRVTDTGVPNLSDEQIVTINIVGAAARVEPEVLPEDVCPPCPVCPECLDGLDNDGDGFIDYPADPGCDSYEDDDESDEELPECSDGLDNDGDGFVDYPFDPGCDSAADDDERDTYLPECSDGLDNDGDGYIDFPADPGCDSAADNDEVDVILPEIIEEPEVLPAVITPLQDLVDKTLLFLQSLRQNFLQGLFGANLAAAQGFITNWLAPILVGLAVINALAAGLPLLIYLRWLFTEPLRALVGRRRKPWGVVYDSLTKNTLDLAIVRIFRKETDKLEETRVTNRKGQYFFIMREGNYYITATKPQYIFPSKHLAGQEKDGKYSDLYFGKTLGVTEDRTKLTPNIPMDAEADKKAKWRDTFWFKVGTNLRRSQYGLAFSGVIFALVSYILFPKLLMLVFIFIHLAMYVLFYRLARRKPPKPWGVVVDRYSGRPIAQAIMRIFDKKYNKLLDTQVTDRKGRYGFLVGPNIYTVTASKQGYRTMKAEDLDLTKLKEGEIITKNFVLGRTTLIDSPRSKKPGIDLTKPVSPPNPASPAKTEEVKPEPADVLQQRIERDYRGSDDKK